MRGIDDLEDAVLRVNGDLEWHDGDRLRAGRAILAAAGDTSRAGGQNAFAEPTFPEPVRKGRECQTHLVLTSLPLLRNRRAEGARWR
ncbi:hypothetical protein GCM10012319_70000 [Comamonas sp. KCTC 72670]|nr:hypothetical protein GCM10012319_70000 [Comamonas sp. KCTC 72670]